MLLEKGGAVLREQGLGALTFKNVFDRLEQETGVRITDASVIRRVWDNLAEFQADVVVAIALEENEDEVDVTVGAVGPLLEDIDLHSPRSREGALRELCRVGGAANLEAMRRSSTWPMWINIWGLAVSAEPYEYRERIEAALVSGYDAFNERIEEVYTAMTEFLGYRLRSPFTLRQFTVAADALGEGCGMRDRVDDSTMEGIVRNTGSGGKPQEWTLFAVAFEALVLQFFEIDPDWHPTRRRHEPNRCTTPGAAGLASGAWSSASGIRRPAQSMGHAGWLCNLKLQSARAARERAERRS